MPMISVLCTQEYCCKSIHTSQEPEMILLCILLNLHHIKKSQINTVYIEVSILCYVQSFFLC